LIWQLCHENTATFEPALKEYFRPEVSSLPNISALPLINYKNTTKHISKESLLTFMTSY
jgi:hypothetical protein